MYQHSQDFRLYIDYGGINLTICFLSRKYSKILFAVFAFFLLAFLPYFHRIDDVLPEDITAWANG